MRHQEMMRALIKEGKEVFCMAPDQRNPVPGVKYYKLGPDKALKTAWGKMVAAYITSFRIPKEVKNVSYVFSVTELQAMALLLVCGRQRKAVRHVLFMRMDPVMVASFNASNPRLSWGARMRLHIKKYLIIRMQRWLFSRLDRIVVQAPFLRNIVVANHPAVSGKVEVLCNAINASWVGEQSKDIRRIIKISEGPIIAYVGNLYYDFKGLGILLDSIRHLKNDGHLQFLIIGDGPDREKLEIEIKQLGLVEKVMVTGAIQNAGDYMESLEVLVASSLLDSCPNVVVEAIQAKTLVCATNINAHRFLLGEEYIGLCEPNGEDMAVAIQKMIYDRDVRKKALEQIIEARERLDFDWGRSVDRLICK